MPEVFVTIVIFLFKCLQKMKKNRSQTLLFGFGGVVLPRTAK